MIHDILLASRESKVILMCNIESAFTQIRLVESHKDLCRFLWLKDINLPPTKDNLILYRFKRLPFGVTASPSITNMALSAFLYGCNTEIAKEIADNIYVHNILLRAESVEEALSKYSQSKKLFAEIGVNLREYISNSNEVNQQIPEIGRLKSGEIRCPLYPKSDSSEVTTNLQKTTKLTKRTIVSQINSFYDPIGLAGPLVVNLKSMMRGFRHCRRLEDHS